MLRSTAMAIIQGRWSAAPHIHFQRPATSCLSCPHQRRYSVACTLGSQPAFEAKARASKSQAELLQQAKEAARGVMMPATQLRPEACQVSGQVVGTFNSTDVDKDVDDVLRKATKGGRLPDTPEAREAIRERIVASLRSKAKKLQLLCPACGAILTRMDGLARHAARCCPDVLPPELVRQAAATNDQQQLDLVLAQAAAAEQVLRRKALEITFLSPGPSEEGTNTTAAAAAAGAGLASSLDDDEVELEDECWGGGAASEEQQQQLAEGPSSSSTDKAMVAATQQQQVAEEPSNSSRSNSRDQVDVATPQQQRQQGRGRSKSEKVQTGPGRISAQLGLPLKRCQILLRQAMKSIPLPVDHSGLDVLYEDEDFIAVNKPWGCNTAPNHRWQTGSVVNLLMGHLAAQGHPDVKPYVLHRLDMDTSGVLLFGKRREVVPGVAAAFRERKVTKEYLAITVGVPLEASFEVIAAIDRHPSVLEARRTVDQAADGGPEARPALTRFQVVDSNPGAQLLGSCCYGELFHERGQAWVGLEGGEGPAGSSGSGSAAAGEAGVAPAATGAAAPGAGDGARAGEGASTAGAPAAAGGVGLGPGRGPLSGAALLRCWPKSGRTHQIRLHLAHLGHPLIGDELYGVSGPWIGRQALHAAALELEHPLTRKVMRFEAPLHDDFKAALKQLGLTTQQGQE